MVNANDEQRGTNWIVAALLAIALGAGFCVGALMTLWSGSACCLHHSHSGIGLHTPQ